MIDSNETFAVRITIADDVYASILCATSYDLSALHTCVVPYSGNNGEGGLRRRGSHEGTKNTSLKNISPAEYSHGSGPH